MKTVKIKNLDEQANFLWNNGGNVVETSPFGTEGSEYKGRYRTCGYVEFVCDKKYYELIKLWNENRRK